MSGAITFIAYDRFDNYYAVGKSVEDRKSISNENDAFSKIHY